MIKIIVGLFCAFSPVWIFFIALAFLGTHVLLIGLGALLFLMAVGGLSCIAINLLEPPGGWGDSA